MIADRIDWLWYIAFRSIPEPEFAVPICQGSITGIHKEFHLRDFDGVKITKRNADVVGFRYFTVIVMTDYLSIMRLPKKVGRKPQLVNSITTALLLMSVLAITGCEAAQSGLDDWSLKHNETQILEQFQPGDPGQLAQFVKNFDLTTNTQPSLGIQIQTMLLDRWRLSAPSNAPLLMEKIIFPSLIRHSTGPDNAVFYLYRHGDDQPHDTILWVPGMGVSDTAFKLIKHFFNHELTAGYNIAFYIPPFHLDRREPGKGNGEGFFTADVQSNVQVIVETVRELRTMVQYLTSTGVGRIAGWGGSMGAATLLLTAQTVDMDFLCLMIPVVDWETVFFNTDTMGRLSQRLETAGFDEALLKQALALISPVNYGPGAPAARTLIQYARYDQLTPPQVIVDYAQKLGITNLFAYNRSHATILLTPDLYTEHDRFIEAVSRRFRDDTPRRRKSS